MHLDGLAVEIAGLGLPVLAFAFVGRKLYRLPARKMECFVDVEQRLDVVIAGRDIGEAASGIPEGGRVHDGGRSGRKRVDIEAKGLLRLGEVFENLEARFFLVVGGDQKQDVAVERRGAGFFGEGDFEMQDGGLAGNKSGEGEQKG